MHKKQIITLITRSHWPPVAHWFCVLAVCTALAFSTPGYAAKATPNSGANKTSNRTSTAPVPPLLQVSRGKASFYSKKLDNTKTANGQRHDQNQFTAAHKSLPFGTVVRVTNLRNGRETIVRINDRGPFTKGRVIDLSRAAASQLNMLRAGVTDVQVEVVGNAKGKISQPGTAFFLAYKDVTGKHNPEKILESARESIQKVDRNKAKKIDIITEAWPGRTARSFVGIGPYTAYSTIQTLQERLKKNNINTTIRCIPANLP